MLCFALFWHALDIIWVMIFTVVYLMGVASMTEARLTDRADREIGRRFRVTERERLFRVPCLHDWLALAVVLTATSFWVANTSVLWTPGVPAGLAVLAIAQMGVHLVFFLHITTGPDNTNNVLALAFGILIITLVVAGSLWIMADLNANMMMSPDLMNLHMQH